MKGEAMASLKDVKEYLQAGPMGHPVPLGEMKELSAEDRADLCAELDKLTDAERAEARFPHEREK